MGSTTGPTWREDVHSDAGALSDLERMAVLHELEAILSSPIFQTSKRCQQFLSYVVQHRLEGNHDRLKERTIGVDLFHRPAGYATGDDPVVRVQAGEVRRRLEKYYSANTAHSGVCIEIHVGSYTPEFRWETAASYQQEPPQTHPALQEEATNGTVHEQEPRPAEWSASPETNRPRRNRKPLVWVLSAIGLAVFAALVTIGSVISRSQAPKSTLEQFWSPALSSSQPVLICLAKPAVYLPSVKLYQRHSKTPKQFTSQFERLSQRPDLQPNDKMVWGDMVEYPDYGLAAGDVYAATGISALFGQIGKKNQVRIGGNYSFEDLRNSPAVVIGAFNNRWTMQMTSTLHFAFAEEGDQSIIREEAPPARRWRSETDPNGRTIEDYAVITRLLDSKTGQFVVVVAGIKSYGTQAAGEFVSNPEYLRKALQAAPHDWPAKNVQIVIQATITDLLPGPPQAVAVYVW
jgi:hypothetical protein